MASINKVIIMGYVGKKPEIRFLKDNKKVCSFSVATKTEWFDKSANEKKSKTDWHKIVIFQEKIAEFCEKYVNVGDLLYIEGKIQYREINKEENNDDNQANQGFKNFITEIMLSYEGVLQKISSKGEGLSNKGSNGGSYDEEEVLPF